MLALETMFSVPSLLDIVTQHLVIALSTTICKGILIPLSEPRHSIPTPMGTGILLSEPRHSIPTLVVRTMLVSDDKRSISMLQETTTPLSVILHSGPLQETTMSVSDMEHDLVSLPVRTISLSDMGLKSTIIPHPISSQLVTGSMEVEDLLVLE